MLPEALLFLTLLAAGQAQYGKPAASHTHSQTTCPWLTQGSASRLLDGNVSTKVSLSDTGEGFCRFVQEGSHDTLQLIVSKGPVASCPGGSKALRGVGNQAALCRAPGPQSGAGSMVSGRVRDVHFTVTQISRSQKSPVQTDALEQVAEQVAGNLF
jgi:hypothetical protein